MFEIIQRFLHNGLAEENERLKKQLLEEKTITISKVNSLDVKKDDVLVITSEMILPKETFDKMSSIIREAFKQIPSHHILLFEGGLELSIVKVKGK